MLTSSTRELFIRLVIDIPDATDSYQGMSKRNLNWGESMSLFRWLLALINMIIMGSRWILGGHCLRKWSSHLEVYVQARREKGVDHRTFPSSFHNDAGGKAHDHGRASTPSPPLQPAFLLSSHLGLPHLWPDCIVFAATVALTDKRSCIQPHKALLALG